MNHTDNARSAALLMRNAAALLASAAALLDDHGDACAACGTTRYRNWVQHKVREVVVSLPERLQRAAADLESGRSEKGPSKRRGGRPAGVDNTVPPR